MALLSVNKMIFLFWKRHQPFEIFMYTVIALGCLKIIQLSTTDVDLSAELKRKSSDQNDANISDLIAMIEMSHQKGVPELAKVLLEKGFLESPSKHPYNLRNDSKYSTFKKSEWSWAFIKSILMTFYKDRPPGFFVEAGALDGEYLSNTLYLEKSLNWTGLLVEPFSPSYKELKKKGRKSWITPLCLATKRHSHEAILKSYPESKDWFLLSRSTVRLQEKVKYSSSYFDFEYVIRLIPSMEIKTPCIDKNITDLEGKGYATYSQSVCIPAFYLLEALNVTHVDFFSLDVEGAEIDILTNFPFHQIKVDLWAIEHYTLDVILKDFQVKDLRTSHLFIKTEAYIKEDVNFVSFMESKGYYLFDINCDYVMDYIFLRRESILFRNLKVPHSLWKRREICMNKKQYLNKPRLTKKLQGNRAVPISHNNNSIPNINQLPV